LQLFLDSKCFKATVKVTHIDSHYGIVGKNLYFEILHLAYKKNCYTMISKILFEKKNEWSEGVNTQPKDIVFASARL